MATDRNESRLGGPYMVQDRDHMVDVSEVSDKANRGSARQAEQSQAGSRQQGGDQGTGRQQGGGRRQVQ